MHFKVYQTSATQKKFAIQVEFEEQMQWVVGGDTLQVNPNFKAATIFDSPDAAKEAAKLFFEASQDSLTVLEEGDF